VYLLEPRAVEVRALKAGAHYAAEWFDPVDGVRQPAFKLTADAQGHVEVAPPAADPPDWALVLKLQK